MPAAAEQSRSCPVDPAPGSKVLGLPGLSTLSLCRRGGDSFFQLPKAQMG